MGYDWQEMATLLTDLISYVNRLSGF